jgi:hypothetical protein
MNHASRSRTSRLTANLCFPLPYVFLAAVTLQPLQTAPSATFCPPKRCYAAKLCFQRGPIYGLSDTWRNHSSGSSAAGH